MSSHADTIARAKIFAQRVLDGMTDKAAIPSSRTPTASRTSSATTAAYRSRTSTTSSRTRT